jgi:hypothetical protein
VRSRQSATFRSTKELIKDTFLFLQLADGSASVPTGFMTLTLGNSGARAEQKNGAALSRL